MEVETFEATEMVETGEVECSEEQIALLKELDLEGQNQLIGDEEDEDEVVACPYRKMTSEEQRVYQTVCPKQERLGRFKEHVIPLRVLQIISHALTLSEVIGELYVWRPETEVDRDPVLVAKPSEYGGVTFILARWGRELRPFAELKVEAGRILKAKRVAELKKIASQAAALAESTESISDETAIDSGMSITMPSFYDR